MNIRDYLAELFLDKDFKETDADFIARGCVESGLSIEEIEDILINELAPVCLPHLVSGSGPWSGWPEGLGEKELEKTGRASFWKRLLNKRSFNSLVADDLEQSKKVAHSFSG